MRRLAADAWTGPTIQNGAEEIDLDLIEHRQPKARKTLALSNLSTTSNESSKISKPTTTMSREAYQVPSLGGGNTFSNDNLGAGSLDGPIVAYLCGDCNARVSLKRGDQIRCKECGHRVLYKERTKRMVQFEAR
ncbi:DNA directed RNA polymerase [Aspergillus recurvatus]